MCCLLPVVALNRICPAWTEWVLRVRVLWVMWALTTGTAPLGTGCAAWADGVSARRASGRTSTAPTALARLGSFMRLPLLGVGSTELWGGRDRVLNTIVGRWPP